MEHPVAGVVGDKGYLGALARRDQHRVAPLAVLGRRAIPRDHAERVTVEVDRVVPGGLVVDSEDVGLASRERENRLHVRHVVVRHGDAIDRPHRATAHHSAHAGAHSHAAHHSTHASAHAHSAHHAAGQRHLVALRVRDVWLWDRIDRKLGGWRQRLCSERLIAVSEIDELVGQAFVKAVDDRYRATGLTRHVQHQVGPHGRPKDHSASFRRMGFDRLPIKRNYERPMAFEFEPEDPRGRGIDETKTQPLATAHGEAIGHATVDRDGIPDPSRHAHFHRAVETAGNRCIVFEPPVAQYPDNVAVHRQRLGLFDNESAHEAATDLFGAMRMGVVPVRSGVRHAEFVIKASAGFDRWLCHAGRTIHRVWHAHAVPMDGRVFRQFVLDHYP